MPERAEISIEIGQQTNRSGRLSSESMPHSLNFG
ncbi:hypothetical protein L598_001100000660 [Mesorhizobium sp. J18]|nr:hypothetical protein L598_001100000660 [Mesorhizobium sp. J18]